MPCVFNILCLRLLKTPGSVPIIIGKMSLPGANDVKTGGKPSSMPPE